MPKTRSTGRSIDDCLDELEQLAAEGHPVAAAIRQLADASSITREFSKGAVFEATILRVVGPLIDALRASTRPTTSNDFEQRARKLAADVMQIGFDDGGDRFSFNDIMRAQHDARRLLTGIDEGPFVPDADN